MTELKDFFKKVEASLGIVRAEPMQDFTQVFETVKGIFVVVGIQCVAQNRFTMRLGVVGDQIILENQVKEVGSISFYGNREEVMSWIKLNFNNFLDMVKHTGEVK